MALAAFSRGGLSLLFRYPRFCYQTLRSVPAIISLAPSVGYRRNNPVQYNRALATERMEEIMRRKEKLNAIAHLLERYARSHDWRYNNLWWENVLAEEQAEPCYSCGSPIGAVRGLIHEDLPGLEGIDCRRCECRFDAEEILKSIEIATRCNEQENDLEEFWSYTVNEPPSRWLMEALDRGSNKCSWDRFPDILEFLHITGCAEAFLRHRQEKLELELEMSRKFLRWPTDDEWDEEDYGLDLVDGKTQSELQADLVDRKKWEKKIPSLSILETTILLEILSAIGYEGTHALSFFEQMKSAPWPPRPTRSGSILGDWNDPTAYRTYGGG